MVDEKRLGKYAGKQKSQTMKLKILTTVSTLDHPGVGKLEASLKLFGYDYTILRHDRVNWGWGGWETVIEWINSPQSQGYTHIIYTDGFDTLALAPPAEAESKLAEMLKHKPDAFIYSVEKHWFPHEGGWEIYKRQFDEKTSQLSPNNRWRYVNGGQYAGSIQAVKNWYNNAPKERNNQAWGNCYYATQNDGRLILDFDCQLFQTISHSGAAHGSPEEFSIINCFDKACTKKLANNLTESEPCFVHANGIKNPEESKWMYELLNL